MSSIDRFTVLQGVCKHMQLNLLKLWSRSQKMFHLNMFTKIAGRYLTT